MKHVSVARFVTAVELPVILVLAPALLFPTPKRLLVLTVVPIIWACARIASGRYVPRTPMNAALWLMLAMVGISLYATFDVRFSLGKVSGVVLGTLLFWSIVRLLTTVDRLKVAIAVFLVVGAGFAIIGLLSINDVGKVATLGMLVERLPIAIRGVPGAEQGVNPNPIAGCLVLFVPLQVALLATGAHRSLFPPPRTHRTGTLLVVTQSILLLLTAGTVLLMQSRGAWAGLVLATVSFVVWHSRKIRMLTAIAAGAVILAAALSGDNRVSQTISRSGLGGAGDLQARLEIWSSAIHGIQDFPFTGIGMNAFRKVMPIRYLAFLRHPDADVPHAHNHLLQAALDLGIPGLVAYGSIWMVAGMLLARVYRHAEERTYRAIAGGLAAGLIAHFVFNMTDAIPLGSKVGALFWLTLALTAGLHHVAMVARLPVLQRSSSSES